MSTTKDNLPWMIKQPTESQDDVSCLSYALRYAAKRWYVFPVHSITEEGVCSCAAGAACANPGKHPRTKRGLHDATIDPEAIRAWWTQWPDANIAIDCARSGVDVFDADVKNGGLESLDEIQDKYGPMPDTPTAFTGGGGRHYCFAHHPGVRNRAGILPGIDVRGEGGYFIVEPSNHASGNNYVWDAECDPLDGAELAPWPPALLELVLPKDAGTTATKPDPTADIADGGRNNALAAIAGTMRNNGMSQAAIEAALQTINAERCNPPLAKSEVSMIAWSVGRYEPERDVAADATVDISGLMGQVEERARPEQLDILVGADWAGIEVPEREWLVPDWMPMRQTTALYAQGGTGKTLVAQQLLTAVATGGEWLDMAVRRGPCVGVFCEDDADELHRRQTDINAAMGVAWGDLSDLHILPRVGHDNLLMDFDQGGHGTLTKFWHSLYGELEQINPTLVVIDTAADTFGGNENIRPQVRQYVQQALTQIATRLDCAVVLCAHPSASGVASGEGTGGSTAWENSVRSRLYMQRDEGGQKITMTRKKSNYSASGNQHSVAMFWYQGALQTYADTDRLAQAMFDSADTRIEHDFFRLLDHVEKQGQRVSASPNGNYAPRIFAKIGRNVTPPISWSQTQFEDALHRLIDQGRIETRGAPKRGTYLCRAGDED